jgi:hypothetical protein
MDFNKAYDRVDLSFLFAALERLGCPQEFIGVVKLLFLNAEACVSINGRTTGNFPVGQGVRQGCPLAPYLFLVIGEVLNLTIKEEARVGRICGIRLPGAHEEQIIGQYADDTNLTLRAEEQPVLHTVATLEKFCQVSGLNINWNKTLAYFWARGNQQRPAWTNRLNWQWAAQDEVSKLLGTPFGLSL